MVAHSTRKKSQAWEAAMKTSIILVVAIRWKMDRCRDREGSNVASSLRGSDPQSVFELEGEMQQQVDGVDGRNVGGSARVLLHGHIERVAKRTHHGQQ
jgi:hypothetical protein